MASHMQVPTWQGKENTFVGRKRKLEGLQQNRVHGFSLVESLPAKKMKSVFFLLGSAIVPGHESSRSGLPALFN